MINFLLGGYCTLAVFVFLVTIITWTESFWRGLVIATITGLLSPVALIGGALIERRRKLKVEQRLDETINRMELWFEVLKGAMNDTGNSTPSEETTDSGEIPVSSN